MKIDAEYNFRWITTGKFIRAGEKAGLTEKIVREQIREMIANMSSALEKINTKEVVKHPAEIYKKIQSGIEMRMKQLCEM